MESTNKRRENLTWPDEDKTRKQLEAIRELAKELRTDYPTDTPDEPTNWSNEARNRRNAYIRAQFVTDENGITLHLLTGSEWLELFDMLGFSVDKETRKRFASHLNWYSFWYADFKPRLSSKYAQRIHWYVYNFLFCLRNKLQTEKDYREGKYGSKGQAYFMEIEQQPSTPTETPRISTETTETVNVSVEGEKAAESANYRVSRIGGYKIIVGDREQGKVIAVLMAVNGHNTIEINDESAHVATMGEKPLQIDKPIMQLSDTEVLELVYNHTEPPQSPGTEELVLSSREEVLAHLDKLHGLEYDAGEVVYFMDGCTAEEQEDGAIWYVYPDAEGNEVIQTLRIAPQMSEAPHKVA